MANVHLGSTSAVEQPTEVSYDTRRGYTTIRRFKGPSAAITSKESELISLGYSTRIRKGPFWELEATIGGDARDGGAPTNLDPAVDTWELFANVVEKDLLQSDNPSVANISQHDITLLRNILDGKVDLEQYLSADPAFTDVGSGDPLGIFRLIVSGVKSDMIFQPVMRHTKTVAASQQIAAAIQYSSYVFSTAKLVSDYNVPSSISANIPPSSTTNRGDGVTLFHGWLKVYPQIQISAYSKSQIVQEYQWGQWATLLYNIRQ